MTVAEYIRLVAKIAVLKEVAEEHSGKTIDNIIAQMELIKNEFQERQKNEFQERQTNKEPNPA